MPYFSVHPRDSNLQNAITSQIPAKVALSLFPQLPPAEAATGKGLRNQPGELCVCVCVQGFPVTAVQGAEKVPWQPLLLGRTVCCKGKKQLNVQSTLRAERGCWAVTPHSRKLSLGTGLTVSRDIEGERRKQCLKVDRPHLLVYHLRCALLHGEDFSLIKPQRQTLRPRLSTRSLSQLCGLQGKHCYLLMSPVPKSKKGR